MSKPTGELNAFDVDATYRIVARVYKLAVRDARRGCPEAKEWLQCVAPDVFEKLVNQEKRTCQRRKKF